MWQRLLRRRADSQDSAAAPRGLLPAQRGSRPAPWWARLASAARKPAFQWATVVVLLLALNTGLLWDSLAQRRELAALSRLYNDEVSWLRTAENLLVSETPPAARAQLAPPQNAAAGAGESGTGAGTGNAALYYAYGDVFYLIVKARGLEPKTAYEVWLRNSGEPQLLGIFVSSAAGDGTLVYRGQAPLPLASLGVRAVGASGPALTSLLTPVSSDTELPEGRPIQGW